MANSLFLQDKQKFNKGKNKVNQKVFEISSELKIAPRICSEFFYEDFNCDEDKVVCLFINDSWFIPYFRKIMKNLALLKTRKTKNLFLYVGY